MSRRRTLLIVEDDAELLEFFRMSLTAAGFEVRTATNGLQALQRLDAFVPDVVILDLLLPAVSGEGVLVEIASSPSLRRVPVIVVTGTSVRPNDPNVFCTLQKPVTADQLEVAVRRCLGRSPGDLPPWVQQ